MSLTPGTQLGPYLIEAPLGAGGMGEVYRARDPRLRREVAVKVLPQYLAQNADRLQRFEHEAHVLSALNHPNLLAIYDVGTQDGIHYLVSELLEGISLRQRLSEGPLPVRKAVEYAVQMAKGLAAAHDKSVVHRDLKPENLFLTKDGRLKILDFGLAKVKETANDAESSALTLSGGTEPGVVMGTVGYMSPEQVRGRSPDHRGDVFAFGTVLYEMLTGRRAFQKPTAAETMSAIANEDPPGISQVTPSVSPALHKVLQRCLEKSPEQRFQSASDLAFALEALSDSGSSATSAITQAESRNRWIWLTVVGITIATVAASAAWWTRPPANPAVESVSQLTNDGELKGNLETDGTRIYFNEGSAGSLRIAQVSVDGGQIAPVTTKVPDAYLAAISADGSSLLITVGLAVRAPLWLLPLPAGEARRLGEIESTNGGLFPDGRVIYTLGSGVYIATKDGTGGRKLAEVSPYSASQPQVSPDAKQIVFGTSDDERLQWGPIYEMAADGTGLHQLLKGGTGNLPQQICCGTWTMNGKYLLFLGLSEGRWNLWAAPQEKRVLHKPDAPVQLTNGPLSYDAVIGGRNDKKIFATGTQKRGELVRYDAVSRQFVPYFGGLSASWPSFSRDGKWMSYIAYPEQTLWRCRTDGSDRLQLTFPPAEVTFAQISPDGTEVAFNTSGSVHIVSTNGGSARKLTEGALGANWSPDGNLLTFISLVPGKHSGEKARYQEGILDVRNGQLSVVPGSQNMLGPWFATQDTLVGATEDASKLLLLNIKTQRVSELATNRDGFVSWAVSPDGKYLYCSTGGNEPKAFRIRFADHAVEPVTNLKNLRIVPDWSGTIQVYAAPDSSLLVTRDIGTQEIYALTVKWP